MAAAQNVRFRSIPRYHMRSIPHDPYQNAGDPDRSIRPDHPRNDPYPFFEPYPNNHPKRTGWDAPGGMCCISRTLRAGSSCCNNSEQTCSSNPPSAQFCAQFSLSATPPGQTRKAACPGLSSVAAWLNREGSVCLCLFKTD